MIIITTGSAYTDIDSYACCIAYADFLNFQGSEAVAVLPGPLNSSVTEQVRALGGTYYSELPDDLDKESLRFVIQDISDPTYVAPFVRTSSVIELFDHHFGHERDWDAFGTKVHIEEIGACATLVYETIAGPHANHEMLLLLYTAIISNTLNLRASVTTDRDRAALEEIEAQVSIPPHWKETYFKEYQRAFFENTTEAVMNDTKSLDINGTAFTISQVELWESSEFMKEKEKDLMKLSNGYENYFLTSPSIGEGINYIFCADQSLREILNQTIGAKFEGNIGKTQKLLLRKEIIRDLKNR